jgi:hypothetical protein
MSDLTLTPKQNIQRLDRLTNWLLGLILFIPFLISFGALRDLSQANGVSYPWLYPIMIDGGLIIFKAIALRASLRGRRDHFAWGMAVAATAISVFLNVVHVPAEIPTQGLARFMAALPPLVILTAFIAVSRRVEETAEWETAVATYQDLQTAIQTRQAELDAMLADKQAELDARIQAGRRELDKLSKQLAPLSQQRADLLAELDALQGQVKGARLSNLGDIGGNERPDLDKANAKRLSKKEQAMQRLLAYVAEHPDATLAEIGEAIGRSRSTVGNYVSELRDAGALHKNGQGWETDAIA